MKRTDPKSLAQILDEGMAAIGQSDTFDALRLADMWPEVVGPGINRLTRGRYVASGVLHVFIDSAALKNELMYGRRALVDALNAAVGRHVIDDVVFH